MLSPQSQQQLQLRILKVYFTLFVACTIYTFILLIIYGILTRLICFLTGGLVLTLKMT